MTWTRAAVGVALVAGVVGCSRTEAIAVSTTPAGAFESSLATFSDGLVSAWYDTRDGHPEIYIRSIDGEGQPVGPERRLTSTNGAAYEADIQPLRSDIVIGWYEKAVDGRLTPRLGAWTRDGKALWTKVLAASGRNTVVRTTQGAVFAAWLEDGPGDAAAVWGGWWRADGSDLIPPQRLADAGVTTTNLNAAIDPAASPGRPRAWVIFDAKVATQAEELFLLEATDGPPRVVRLTADDGRASKYPDIAFENDRVAITWFDARDGNQEVYLAAGQRGLLTTDGVRGSRVTMTPGHSIGAYVTWSGERIGLAWCDDSDGGQHEVFFQSFTAGGSPDGEALRLTHTSTASLIPAIKPWKSGFALAWNEYDAPPGDGHEEGRPSQVVFRLVP